MTEKSTGLGKRTTKSWFILATLSFLAFSSMLTGCGGSGGDGSGIGSGGNAASSNKDITSFSILGVNGTISGSTISLTLPNNTNRSSLIATYSATGVSVRVGNTTQTSGSTANDFANPVIYTVVAEDGTTKNYTVTTSVTGDLGPTCADTPGLVWKTANTTHYESYPDPNSEECIKYSGCKYQGQFQMCGNVVKPETWVASHNIVAFFPLGNMGNRDLCLKSGSKSIRVTVLDTCADSDCNGCCTQNKGNAAALIDLEKYTYQRFGVPDGAIQWADMGPTVTGGCN